MRRRRRGGGSFRGRGGRGRRGLQKGRGDQRVGFRM